MRVATWNVQWADPGAKRSTRGARVAAMLADLGADVLVVTEGCRDLLPAHGHVIDGGGDWGYGIESTRRKVLAWSAHPWVDVVRLDSGASRGRVVRGRTATPLGEVTVTAVCIPWAGAHVAGGRRDARPWDEHLECCLQLAELPTEPRSILAGDFNQRIPKSRQPIRVATALDLALKRSTPWTAGDRDGRQLIDHIATSRDLAGAAVTSWPGKDSQGHLSDHSGVSCVLTEAKDTSP